MAGVKNTCCGNLQMRLWLTKRITFLCILWILKGYIKISWYVPRTHSVCSWELLRLDDYQNYVSLGAKAKSQRVKLSQITVNVWVWHRFMPKQGALTVHSESSSDPFVPWRSPRKQRPKKRIFLSCKSVKLWAFFRSGRFEEGEELLWMETIFGSTKTFNLDFHCFY